MTLGSSRAVVVPNRQEHRAVKLQPILALMLNTYSSKFVAPSVDTVSNSRTYRTMLPTTQISEA